MNNIINYILNKDKGLFLIAGPCVMESRALCMDTASEIKNIAEDLDIPFVFKASFDKANRTSLDSFRGPGIEEGMDIFKDIKDKLNIPLLTDIHLPEQAEKVSEIVDIIQIPAFLCRQTDLIVSAGKTQKTVNIKKGQFLAPWDIENAIKKVEAEGNKRILITERGSCFGYNNLVVDMTSIPIMQKYGYPVVFDATHSVQKPGGAGKCSSGKREFVPVLSKAAVAAGCRGLYMEVHPNPDKALSDASNMINFSVLREILIKTKAINSVI